MSFFKNLSGLNKKMNVSVTDETDTAPQPAEDTWLAQDYEEGQLAIDVYQTSDAIVLKSTIAGVKPEDIDISMNNDMLTIRGTRKLTSAIAAEDYFYQECYWGGFSRSIILPVEVKADGIEASLENGILTVILPKAATAKQISVTLKD